MNWSSIHAGGLPLTILSINYSFVHNFMLFNGSMVVHDLNITSTTVSDLVVGFVYMFTLTAERSDMSSTTPCGSILLTVGRNILFMPQVLLMVIILQVYQPGLSLEHLSVVLALEKSHCK